MTTSVEFGLAISRGHSKDPLAKAANAVGYTLPRLAEAVSLLVGRRVTKSSLIMARSSRPIRRDVAEAVAKLTRSQQSPRGFEATSKNWWRIED